MRVATIGAALLLFGSSAADAESGKASYYRGIGKGGEMTCAHRTRSFGSMIKVSYRGHAIQCRVNDRGVYILEVAARPIGGLCAKALGFQKRNGGRPGELVTLEELLMRHALGESPTDWRREPADRFRSTASGLFGKRVWLPFFWLEHIACLANQQVSIY